MIVLGLHFEHDAGATLMNDGRILANIEAERVTGVKHASGLEATRAAVKAAFTQSGVRPQDVDALAFSDLCQGNVYTAELDRLPEIQRQTHADGLAARLGTLADVGFDGILGADASPLRAEIPVFVTCHSMSHAAGAVYMAGFPDAIGLVIDGYGTCCGTMGYAYHDHVLTRREAFQDRFLLGTGYHGIGILAREIVRTEALDVAGKVMGLQAYGQPRPAWVHYFRHRYFASSAETGFADYGRQASRFSGALSTERFCAELFPGGLRPGSMTVDDPIYRDLVASMQEAFTLIVCDVADELAAGTTHTRLFLSGGCALNIVANAAVARLPWLSSAFVPPNASDCGQAMGSAVLAMHAMTRVPLHRPEIDARTRANPYTGAPLLDRPAHAEVPPDITVVRFDWDSPEHLSGLAGRFIAGEIIGVLHGPSEIGPRALGNRSILALASHPGMKDLINHKIKRREWWRPFAPVCRLCDAGRYFDPVVPSRYMLMHSEVRDGFREALSSITHVDQSCRLQTLAERDDNPRLWDLLMHLEQQGAVPVFINTSFNLSRKPIANSTAEAIDLLTRSQLDAVIVEDQLFTKTAAGRLLRERAEIAPYVDETFYCALYPDVSRASGPALDHYVAHGWQEGRDPNAWFSTRRYLERYPDVAKARCNPLWDFVTFGWRVGRRAPRRDPGSGPDVKIPRLLLESGVASDPAALSAVAARLDAAFYEAQLLDLGMPAGDRDYARHYLLWGAAYGIDPAPWFSGDDYLHDFDDVCAAGLPPFLHFVSQGEAEGRRIVASRASAANRFLRPSHANEPGT